tara:strand:+ start:245 stop:694 length:450 start_codon:yes stop_codon:yes gene_type:complete
VAEIKILIKRLSKNKDFVLPNYQSSGAVGVDLSASIDSKIILKPLDRSIIPCGISISLPKNIEGQVRPRSGLAAKHGITVLNTPGTIDSDYRGEIKVILINLGKDDFTISQNDRIAQIVFSNIVKANFEEIDSLDDTERGSGGFGSTGQ